MAEQKIVPLGKDMTFLEAFNETRMMGGLPSNVQHDETLSSPSLLQQVKNIFGSYYSAWCREMIAYPAQYGVFAKGDIEDSDYNWVLPARYVPKAAVGKKDIALLIDPKDLKVEGDKVTVIPQSVKVIPFAQTDGLYGFDKTTGMPTNKKPTGAGYWDARYLWRRSEQTLRPLARYDGVGGYGRRFVDAYRRPDYRLGVGVVEPQRKLKRGTEPQVIDETFRTKVLKSSLLKLPRNIKVKQGTSVEVRIWTP